MTVVCKFCNDTKKDALGNPCSHCTNKSLEKPDLLKRFGDFDLRK